MSIPLCVASGTSLNVLLYYLPECGALLPTRMWIQLIQSLLFTYHLMLCQCECDWIPLLPPEYKIGSLCQCIWVLAHVADTRNVDHHPSVCTYTPGLLYYIFIQTLPNTQHIFKAPLLKHLPFEITSPVSYSHYLARVSVFMLQNAASSSALYIYICSIYTVHSIGFHLRIYI